jgi:hypothetical protein
MAWWRALSIQTLAWTGSGSLPVSSRKFVLRSHPADVVLSVIERAQSPRCRRPANKSTHGEMIKATYFRKLLDA